MPETFAVLWPVLPLVARGRDLHEEIVRDTAAGMLFAELGAIRVEDGATKFRSDGRGTACRGNLPPECGTPGYDGWILTRPHGPGFLKAGFEYALDAVPVF
jgi:hypothetical protein